MLRKKLGHKDIPPGLPAPTALGNWLNDVGFVYLNSLARCSLRARQ